MKLTLKVVFYLIIVLLSLSFFRLVILELGRYKIEEMEETGKKNDIALKMLDDYRQSNVTFGRWITEEAKYGQNRKYVEYSVKYNELKFPDDRTYRFKKYDKDDFIEELILFVTTCLFAFQLLIFIPKRLNKYEYFISDFLLYRPRWFNVNLGIRRIISLISNSLIFFGFALLFLTPILFITNFPHIFIGDSEFRVPLINYFIGLSLFMWVFWGLMGIIIWISSGFRKKS